MRFLADPNIDLRRDGILMLLYVGDNSMLQAEDATKAVLDLQARVLEKWKITNLGLPYQILGIGIHCEKYGTEIRLGQKAFITTVHK